jgi:hypothetical protein
MPADLLMDEWFASTYNFTPQQVREMPVDAVTWFPVIAEARGRAAQAKADQQRRMGG